MFQGGFCTPHHAVVSELPRPAIRSSSLPIQRAVKKQTDLLRPQAIANICSAEKIYAKNEQFSSHLSPQTVDRGGVFSQKQCLRYELLVKSISQYPYF